MTKDDQVFSNKYINVLWKIVELLFFTIGFLLVLCKVITEWSNYGKEDPMWWVILLVIMMACKVPLFPKWYRERVKT